MVVKMYSYRTTQEKKGLACRLTTSSRVNLNTGGMTMPNHCLHSLRGTRSKWTWLRSHLLNSLAITVIWSAAVWLKRWWRWQAVRITLYGNWRGVRLNANNLTSVKKGRGSWQRQNSSTGGCVSKADHLSCRKQIANHRLISIPYLTTSKHRTAGIKSSVHQWTNPPINKWV